MGKDFELITRGRRSAPVPDTVSVKGSAIFIESGAKLSHCIINADTGPVYIGQKRRLWKVLCSAVPLRFAGDPW